jgi:Ca-activated chloride channel family protein
MRVKLGEVANAVRIFVRSSNPDDQMFVVNFNEQVSRGLPGAMRFSGNADELARAIGDAPCLGTTALYDAIVEAPQGLQPVPRDKKVLIVISDGGDNASRSSLDRVLKTESNHVP